MSHTCNMCEPCSIKNIREHCATCSPCADALTICDECGATIMKPPAFRNFEALKLCSKCVEKKLATF